MLFVLPGFLVYLYSGASVFTAAQKSHPLMRTFVMCFSNGCQNPNNIYWKQRQIHGEIHGHDHGVDDNREFWRRKTSGTFWHQSIAEKNTATPSWRCLSIAVVCFSFPWPSLVSLAQCHISSRVLCSAKDFPNMLPKVSSYGQFDNCGEGPSDNSH